MIGQERPQVSNSPNSPLHREVDIHSFLCPLVIENLLSAQHFSKWWGFTTKNGKDLFLLEESYNKIMSDSDKFYEDISQNDRIKSVEVILITRLEKASSGRWYLS